MNVGQPLVALLEELDILHRDGEDVVAVLVHHGLEILTVGDAEEGVYLAIGHLTALGDGLLLVFVPGEGDAVVGGEELAPIG